MKKLSFFFSTFLVLVPSASLGADPLNGIQGVNAALAKMGEVTAYLLKWGAGIFVIVFIAGGLMYITSAGNPQRTEAAKKTLTAGVIGALIMFFSSVMIQQVANLVGGGK